MTADYRTALSATTTADKAVEAIVAEVAYRMQSQWEPGLAPVVRTAATLALQPVHAALVEEEFGDPQTSRHAARLWRKLADAAGYQSPLDGEDDD